VCRRSGTFTPVLSDEGTDLAAAIETITIFGDKGALARTVDDAFPGSRVDVEVQNGRFEVQLHQHGLLRPLGAASSPMAHFDFSFGPQRCSRRARRN